MTPGATTWKCSSSKAGYFRDTDYDRVMEKVDAEGNVLDFSILKVSSLKGKPIEGLLT